MKQIPEQLLNQAIQCIRLATHTEVNHNTVESVARSLENIRDDDTDETAEELETDYKENQEGGSDEEAEE